MRRNDFFKYILLNGGSQSDKAELESENLPFIFKSNGGRLRNYRIYGNTGGVGDLDTETEKYIIPVVMQNKNILQNTSPSRTFGNLTAVVQEDGTVVLNGTPSITAFMDISTSIYVESGMIFNGCPTGGSSNTYCLRATKLSDNNYATQKGDDIVFTSSENYKINIRINANYTCDNLIFRPMIRYPNTDSTFEPYHEPKVYNICLDEPLKANEYIDFREQKRFNSDNTSEIVLMPALQSVDGTNIIAVETSVQPEKVYVQGNVEQIVTASLQTLNTNLQNLQTDWQIENENSLDVMPIEKPVFNLNEVGGGSDGLSDI
jgi:hypothetical protein